MAAAIGFSVVLMTAFSITVAASVAQRVTLISDAVRALADGTATPDLSLAESDEISRLASDVERLSAKLDASERERARLDTQRVELTARGKLVRELEPKPDRSGQTVKLTIDAGLQEYAARRMGDQSGALVAMDVANGDMLAFVSMPAYDPNSFSDGIGRTEWRMLSEDDHIPLLNKVAQGLYPSGSTIKPAMALAFLKQGIDPARRVHCPGGYQIGNRYFR